MRVHKNEHGLNGYSGYKTTDNQQLRESVSSVLSVFDKTSLLAFVVKNVRQ